MSDEFGAHIEATARKLLGEPNAGLSSKTELRFGAHGSLSVDLDKGCWRDHENERGGGVLALIERQTGLKGSQAVAWLRSDVGADIEDRRATEPAQRARIVQTYDYVSEQGEVVMQVCRMEPKSFRQRRPDPGSPDGWNWSVKGVQPVPYRLPELLRAVASGQVVYVVEGEKDVDALAREGMVATCNPGGAGKWPESFAHYLAGADVVILPDNDAAGYDHRDLVGNALLPVASRVRHLALPELPPKGDVSNWLAMGGTGEDLALMVERRAETFTPQAPASSFGAILWSALDSVQMRQDWLIEDLMFCGDAALMFGASGSGKSFLTVDLGVSVARGVPFLGKKTIQGPVIYQAGEGGKGLVKRLKAYRQENRVVGDVPFVLLPTRADLFAHDGDGEQFIAECKALKAHMNGLALVVIDTLSTASPGANENASEDMSRLLQFGERLQRETGAAILWVHHKNAAGDRERGHTSLRANVDTALEVIRDEESTTRTLRVVKVKDGEDGEKLGFELQSVEIGTYDDGKPMTSCVVRPAQVDDQQTGHKNPTKLSPAQRIYLTCLDDAISQYGGIMPPGEGAPPNSYGVEYQYFTRIYRAVRSSTLDGNAINQALHRDGDALWSKGFIRKADNWLWVTQEGHSALIGGRK